METHSKESSPLLEEEIKLVFESFPNIFKPLAKDLK
jgi:hypothetical protein